MLPSCLVHSIHVVVLRSLRTLPFSLRALLPSDRTRVVLNDHIRFSGKDLFAKHQLVSMTSDGGYVHSSVCVCAFPSQHSLLTSSPLTHTPFRFSVQELSVPCRAQLQLSSSRHVEVDFFSGERAHGLHPHLPLFVLCSLPCCSPRFAEEGHVQFLYCSVAHSLFSAWWRLSLLPCYNYILFTYISLFRKRARLCQRSYLHSRGHLL